jgi:predicted branched-subunit amino acid permease
MTAGLVESSRRYWFVQGMKGLLSLPGFILMSAFVGFTALAFQSGLSRGEATFMTLFVWALPSQMILVGAISSGTSVLATFIAVSLASFRMAPMVAALVPEIKDKKSSSIILLLLSHFVAITAWVYTLKRVSDIPRGGRIPFFAGLGMTLTAVNSLLVFCLYGIVSDLPPLAAGTLYFLTPMYFVMSIWESSRQRVMHWSLILGIILEPLFHWLTPQLDILATGLVGGTVAYLADRLFRAKAPSGVV